MAVFLAALLAKSCYFGTEQTVGVLSVGDFTVVLKSKEGFYYPRAIVDIVDNRSAVSRRVVVTEVDVASDVEHMRLQRVGDRYVQVIDPRGHPYQTQAGATLIRVY